ncbi:MAG: hypothetical protein JKY32_14600 [Rhizobiales bacterium]|nr:hypothetical protein [Hyphomicrobiales bacterium]
MLHLQTIDMDAVGIPVIQTSAAAELLCGRLYKTLDSLRRILEKETGHLRKMELAEVGKIHDQKSTLSRDYLKDLKIFKANTAAIKQQSPSSVESLQRKHQDLRKAIAENERVLGTLREVSETLIRRTATRVGEASRPKTYNPAAKASSGIGAGIAAVACDRQL